MVHNPYDSEESIDDPKKAKLRDQAQQQFIAQLQQRIANQTAQIEELHAQISQIQQASSLKDQELRDYSSRVEEERMWFERDKKARDDREYELQKLVKEKEVEIQKLKEVSSTAQAQALEIQSVQAQASSTVATQINDYIEKLMAYFQKPTNDNFVQALQNLIEYSGSEGTLDQKILGYLLEVDMPKTEIEIAQKLLAQTPEISKAIFRLEQKENIKKVGRGYSIISSDFAEMADITQNWGSLSPEKIFENLMSIIYVEADKQELIIAFTNARDALMEMGVLSSVKTHEMSQIIERLKRHPIDKNELAELIQKWNS